jgi:hypothetical protein
MTFTPSRLAVIALLCATVATPCAAESFASSASSAGSASSGSVSDSIGGSSKSSTGEAKVADGDYRVIEVADVSDRPGLLRLTLQATAPQGEAGEVLLTLPRQALAQRGIAAGAIVSARQRPYGLEFAHADTREAFFLVLADHWHHELAARPLTL